MVAILIAIAVVLFSGGPEYTVKVNFVNASQLVTGDQVKLSGDPVGTVSSIDLTHDGQAQVTLELDEPVAPLRHGTTLTVRATSLSGIANRYVDLALGPAGAPNYASGSVIPATATKSSVDLDEVFNTVGPRQQEALRQIIRGSAAQFHGHGKAAQIGLMYLNPSIAATSALFAELNRDTASFTRYLLGSAHLVGDLAQKRTELAGLVSNLSTTLNAIARPPGALGRAVAELPPFMRRANTTFVNLRATLDDLTPLVNESKPVAKQLQPFLAVLRPFARDARPTVHALSTIVRKRGAANDLVELTRAAVPLAKVTVQDVKANGKTREGALPATTKALQGAVPLIAFARPYAADLVGWFDDYAHSGIINALGGISRVALEFNAFSVQQNNELLTLLPLTSLQRLSVLNNLMTSGYYNRCPGSNERNHDGSTPYDPFPANDPHGFSCDPTQVPKG